MSIENPFEDLDSTLITIRWSNEEGRPLYSIGTMDPWAALTILQVTADAVYDTLALPRDLDAPLEEDPEEEF
jgi:hypothetical protein